MRYHYAKASFVQRPSGMTGFIRCPSRHFQHICCIILKERRRRTLHIVLKPANLVHTIRGTPIEYLLLEESHAVMSL